MAKFYGPIGYSVTTETSPGVWVEHTTERNYSGDVIKHAIGWQSGESVNDNLTVNNTISIVADTYANENFSTMRYVKWMGAFWKIKNIDVQRPRLILTIGGVYNGITAQPPGDT